MVAWFVKRRWPELPSAEIKKRARILVIDDSEFAYQVLFNKDGYNVDKWDDVYELPKLESGYYDLILLDIQGVGKDQSQEQGLGILKHLRQMNPTQIIVAYSHADWSLRYQDFFRMADATLAKTADYVEFKRTVDKLLASRFSLGFYLDKIAAAIGTDANDPQRLRQLAERAILSRSTTKLEKFLRTGVDKADQASLVLQIVKAGITLAVALTAP